MLLEEVVAVPKVVGLKEVVSVLEKEGDFNFRKERYFVARNRVGLRELR